MPTMRSPFKIEQIEKVLQELAHKIPRFYMVKTENLRFEFAYDGDGRPRRIHVAFERKTGRKSYAGTPYEHDEVEYWGFTAEPKDYFTSSDATKISYAYEEIRKKIEQWFEEQMASVKPEPRFSLAKNLQAKK